MYGIVTKRTACRDMVDLRPLAQTYDQCMIGNFIFIKPSHSSCFPYFKVVLVELELIEGFSHI
jgi:hypothetical protein